MVSSRTITGQTGGGVGQNKNRAGKRTGSSSNNSSAAITDALVILTKAPIPGEVKTRLCPPLTPDEAATLHGSFVLDEIERSGNAIKQHSLLVHRYMSCAPSPDHTFFKVLEARHGVKLLPQIGDDLGARMNQSFSTLFQQGYQRVILVGTDLPELPPTTYRQALEGLATHDLVLGPAEDGGYYLIGLTRTIPELFSNIPWSTDQVARLTMERAKDLGLSCASLPLLQDIDRLEDLLTLVKHSSQGKGGPSALSRRTTGVLQALAPRLRDRGSLA